MLRDGDPESMAEKGIPVMPPDLNGVDWEDVKRELHNALVDQGLFTWQDVQREQRGVTSAVKTCLHRRVIELYRQKDAAVAA
jgi:predicted nuclease with TOPRIM domain